MATAGNLSVSQSVLSLLAEGIEDPETGELETLLTVPTMFAAAQLVGRAIRQVYADRRGRRWKSASMSFDVTMLLGGQIDRRPMRLYQIYAAGNAIEATDDTPFPADRRAEIRQAHPRPGDHRTTPISSKPEARADLDGFDAEVEPRRRPADRHRRGQARRPESRHHYRIEEDEPYFRDLRERWSSALRAAHQAIPHPPYVEDAL